MKRYNLDEILLKAEVPDVALRLGMKAERVEFHPKLSHFLG